MNNVTNTPCTVGNYCVQDSVLPAKCAVGKYAPYTGNDEESDCLDCTPGYYCDTQGIHEPTGLCDAGYYCTPLEPLELATVTRRPRPTFND